MIRWNGSQTWWSRRRQLYYYYNRNSCQVVFARADASCGACTCVWVCIIHIYCNMFVHKCVCVCVGAPSNIGRVSALTRRSTRSTAHIAAAVQVYYNIIVVRTRFFVFNRRRRAYDDNHYANEVDTIPTALLYYIIYIGRYTARMCTFVRKKKTNIPFRLNSDRYAVIILYYRIIHVQSVYI